MKVWRGGEGVKKTDGFFNEESDSGTTQACRRPATCPYSSKLRSEIKFPLHKS